MDANKHAVLRQIGYRIPQTCDLCVNGQFNVGAYFGTCALHTYEHEKHSEKRRHLSIYTGGTCSSFKERETAKTLLSEFHQFLQAPSPDADYARGHVAGVKSSIDAVEWLQSLRPQADISRVLVTLRTHLETAEKVLEQWEKPRP